MSRAVLHASLRAAVPRASLCSVVLLLTACGVVEGSLGEHDPQPFSDELSEGDAGPARDGTLIADLLAHDQASSAEPAAPADEAETTPEPEPEMTAEEDPPPEMPMDEAPPAEVPMEEVPPVEEEPPPEVPALCAEPAELACNQCQRDHCCEVLVHCSDDEVCACMMECRGQLEAEACMAECGEVVPEAYEPWVFCLEDACTEAC